MSNVAEEVFQENGFHLHVIPNKKHKTIAFVAKLKAPLDRETITKRALLPYVLQQGTKSFPNSTSLQARLDDLYGAVLSIDGGKKGNNHIISIRLEIANDKFIADESSVIDKGIALLNEVIFQPNVTANCFDERILAREKETLHQKINAIIDDKMSYANMRLIDEMCANEVYQLHVHGYQEDLDTITAENLYDYYQTVVEKDQLDIYVSGDIESREIKEKITTQLGRNEVDHHTEQQTESKKERIESNTVIEKQAIQQAKLHLGYRTNITYSDDDYFALQVFNGIFGGFPSSKLFINVREKNSLAYYAASRFESHKGLLLVFSGIAPQDYEQAREIIELQMEAMKKGEFAENEIEETKGLIVNQLLETMDHPQGIIEMLYQQVIGNKKLPPEQLIADINQVKKQDIVDVANKLELDTVYLLTKNGGNSDE
ncbi:EF-P 5-aminopentanol modification-associated protein YfmF [Lentibacillus sp. Marseille-P4043]|uniref:EF-P 5-aminopentanol modification-associated protein YfmF n=1 Tax=Lentibacillus sp. Marseille-P4043 TaxID=2040293 RepID=UPI000D0B338E|nr:pitrilysin family protein [Lentibacillus sp. Marseille-P4043]